MKKVLLMSGIALLAVSCHKTNNNNPNSGIWNIGNVQYSASVVKKQGDQYVASNGLNSMQAAFSTSPTSSRNYKIADWNKALNNTLAANEVAVNFNVEGTDNYQSTGTANDSASVTIESGILTIKVLSTPVQHYANGPALGVTIANGVIKTNNY